MNDVDQIKVSLESNLSKMFDFALQLNKQSPEEVLTNFIRQYVSESFSKASKSVSPNSVDTTQTKLEDASYPADDAKAIRKIPNWAQKPHQNNHRIIKAYFQIQEESSSVTVDKLTDRCSNPIKYPATFTPDFYGNFASMKTDAGNSNGKVFEVDNGIVSIWPIVSSTLQEYRSLFIGTEESRALDLLFADIIRKATNLDSHTIFTLKDLFGSEWASIPMNSRLMLGRQFFSYTRKKYIKGIKALPEKDAENCQLYEKV
jgi:hypothetical protein